MKLKIALLLNLTAVLLILLDAPVNAASESCIECHLHQSIMDESTASEKEAYTLAAFHVREFERDDPLSGCRECHGERQSTGKLPTADVCTRCHTKGKTTQGNPNRVFHAKKNHWPMKKISCIDCHKGHLKGSPDIKFLTPDVVSECSRCHKKSFESTD